jgi:tRNA/rRNA methyltransferase
MAGTDRTQALILGGPAFVLVRPQLGENIGSAARAMLNFGLSDLRLVEPRQGWPNERAVAASSGAEEVTARARVFAGTPESIADLQHVYAASARPRDMEKIVLTAEKGAQRLHEHIAAGDTAGVLFGPERTGLHNDELAMADAVIAIPANPGFASLNLAHAVLLVGYEWFLGADHAETTRGPVRRRGKRSGKAPSKEVLEMFAHLERELDAAGFFWPNEKAKRMARNIRNMYLRAGLTEQDVRTMRGVIKALVEGNPRARRDYSDK